ncbi:MAG TPA: ATP-binding protein [Rhodoglobus sp.]|nr:ATP-binding protein [Rhodoglobus sp.]
MSDGPARVTLVGSESTGKTTLARDLVDALQARGGDLADTRWVPEYGREYTELLLQRQGVVAQEGEAGTAEWGAADFAAIALEQQRIEDAAAASTRSPVLICDTDAFATLLWEWRYLGRDSNAALVAVPDLPPRALYLLADLADVPFEQDGIRDGEHFRETMQRWFEDELTARGERWLLVRGDRRQRLELSLAAIDSLLADRAA